MIGQAALKKPSVLLTAGVLGGGGAGTPPPTYTAEYQAILDYATAQSFAHPSTAYKTAQNNLIIALKAAGIWTEMDIFYHMMADGSEGFAKINWKAPGTYQLVGVNSPAYISKSGFQFDSTNYLDTGWKPGTNGVEYTQNEAGAGCYVPNNIGISSFDFGCSNNADGITNGVSINVRGGSDNFAGRINTNTTISIPSGQITSQGFYHLQRLTSTSNRAMKNGVSIVTDAVASTAPPTVNLWIGGANGNGALVLGTSRTISMVWAGASLTGKEAAFHNAWNEYLSTFLYTNIITYATSQSFTLPSTNAQEKGRILIRDLLNANVWQSMDIFYNFITDGDLGFARINWKAPSSFLCTVVGNAPAFTVNQGVLFDGAGHFDTGWRPGTNGVQFQQNDAGCVIQVLNTTQATNVFDFGCSANADGLTNGTVFNSAGTAGIGSGRTNSNASISLISGRTEGFWHIRRTASNASSGAKNTGSQGSDTAASVTRTTFNMYIGATNGAGAPVGRTTRRYGMFATGAGVAATGASFWTAWIAYFHPYRAAQVYQAVLDYATLQGYGLPSSAAQTLQLALVRALLDAGIWDFLDTFYVFATDATTSVAFTYINWKAPGTFQITASAPPTFVAKTGYQFNGTNQYLDTNWRPNLMQGYLQNEAGYGLYVATNIQNASAVDCGCSGSADGITLSSGINTRTGTDVASARTNSTTTVAPANTNSIGFYHSRRVGANDVALYKNGVLLGSSAAAASGSRALYDMWIGCSNGVNVGTLWSPRTIGMFWAGSSCVNREATFNTAWSNYYNAVQLL